MAITINGSGTITGLTAGGLPDGSVTNADLEYAGTSGQVLTSQGSGSAPQWATPAAGASEFFDVAGVASTSGVQWTIPSDVNRIVIAYYDLSGASTGNLQVQIGTGGTLQTSGYNFFDGYIGSVYSGTKRANQNAWYTTMSSNSGNEYSGIITIQSVDETNSWWVIDWVNYDDVNAGNTIARVSGNKGFSGRLDIVRFAPTTGNFDSGAVSINYFT